MHVQLDKCDERERGSVRLRPVRCSRKVDIVGRKEGRGEQRKRGKTGAIKEGRKEKPPG